jgi:hypothetical protein
MQERRATVLVYRYSYWDESRQLRRVSVEWATLEAIRKGLGTPILTESQRVPLRDVTNGVWIEKPRPTVS